MGVVGDVLVLLRLYQDCLVDRKTFEKYADVFLDYAAWKLSTYLYFNNGFECLLENIEGIKKHRIMYEFLRKSAIENYNLVGHENDSLKDLLRILIDMNLPSWIEEGACELFRDVLLKDENYVLLVDRVVHFQHSRGTLFDEDVEEERVYAEKTLELLEKW